MLRSVKKTEYKQDLICLSYFSVLQLQNSPTAHEVFSSPVTPSSGARRNLLVNFGSSPTAQNPQPVTLSPTTRQAAAKNAPACKSFFVLEAHCYHGDKPYYTGPSCLKPD